MKITSLLFPLAWAWSAAVELDQPVSPHCKSTSELTLTQLIQKIFISMDCAAYCCSSPSTKVLYGLSCGGAGLAVNMYARYCINLSLNPTENDPWFLSIKGDA